MAVDEKSRKDFIRGEGKAESGMKLLGANGLAELGQVVSGSAAQSFYSRNKKVGST